jgi:hypothetical protein
MSTLIFDSDEVAALVRHAAEASDRIAYCEDAVDDPGLVLVHDDGVYLLSNGHPPQLIGEGPERVRAYARGTNPESDPDWYETARDLVGGDDFAAFLPIEPFEDLIAAELPIEIQIEDDSIEIHVPA